MNGRESGYPPVHHFLPTARPQPQPYGGVDPRHGDGNGSSYEYHAATTESYSHYFSQQESYFGAAGDPMHPFAGEGEIVLDQQQISFPDHHRLRHEEQAVQYAGTSGMMNMMDPSMMTMSTTMMMMGGGEQHQHQQDPYYHVVVPGNINVPSHQTVVYPSVYSTAGHPQSQIHHHNQPGNIVVEDYPTATHPHHPGGVMEADPGLYYPISDLLVSSFYGAPISALAYDETHAAMYVSSMTYSLSNNRKSHWMSAPAVSNGGSGSHQLTRASMLATYSLTDGMLYSSVAGHSEAPSAILKTIYSAIYGIPALTTSATISPPNPQNMSSQNRRGGQQQQQQQQHAIPNHAYRPPYGTTDPALPTPTPAVPAELVGGKVATAAGNYQLGITSLVPVTRNRLHHHHHHHHHAASAEHVEGGYVASISPAAVRLHAHGGLQLADYHVEGMLCGTAHPNRHGDALTTHLTVGGMALLASRITTIHASSNASSSSSFGSSSGETTILPNNNNQEHWRHASKQHVQCLDLWQGLRPVASYSLDSNNRGQGTTNSSDISHVAVTALVASQSRGSIMAGCSDGYIRLLDGQGLREMAKFKSHAGGVVNIAISPDGTLLATTGYGSRSPRGGGSSGNNNTSSTMTQAGGSPLLLYGFPDPTVFVYDIRYLGRGGIPHAFAGLSGGPRYVSFLPDMSSQPSNRFVVASGQPGGGLQIVTPFFSSPEEETTSFLVPQMNRGEAISALCVAEENMAVGTTQGRVLQYKLAGFYDQEGGDSIPFTKVSSPSRGFTPTGRGDSRTYGQPLSVGATIGTGQSTREPSRYDKQLLAMPLSFEPPLPALSLDAALLMTDDPTVRPGATDKIKSIFTAYHMNAEPTVSRLGDKNNSFNASSFGTLSTLPMVAPSRLEVSSQLLNKSTHAVDFLRTVPTSTLDVDLLEDHRPVPIKARKLKFGGMMNRNLANPNKLLYSDLFGLAYQESLNREKKLGRKTRRDEPSGGSGDVDMDIPARYRLTLRPTNKLAASFSHAEFNQTGLLPGWDYPPTMPNAFVPPVLMLLYFIPEVRQTLLKSQFSETTSPKEKILIPEMGFLFHQIECLARFARIFPCSPGDSNSTNCMTRLGAWAPSNFISCLASLPEAEQLQILDESPAAVDPPRRPEAFYRFLLYQIEKEIGGKVLGSKPIDSLVGIDFVSINEFISGSGPPSTTSTRSLTVELSYHPFITNTADTDKPYVRFCDVLQHTLFRETRLRAWNKKSGSYETIVQRRIAVSLPEVLSLSCSCAGRKEEEGLALWRTQSNPKTDSAGNHWLPEIIEVELEDNGNVIVRELYRNESDGSEEWKECKSSGPMPKSVEGIISKTAGAGASSVVSSHVRRYRLDAVVSMVRDDYDRKCPDEIAAVENGTSGVGGPGSSSYGHHVLHARISKSGKKRILTQQRDELQKLMASDSVGKEFDLTLLGLGCDVDLLRKRLDHANKQIAELDCVGGIAEDDWILFNGYVASNTVIEDARAFHVEFKEPSLVVFRCIDKCSIDKDERYEESTEQETVSPEVIKTQSITNGSKSPYVTNQKVSSLPGEGDLIAFDAEFVSVQEEESILTESGSKVTIRETRHALARISVIDCRNSKVIFDDHVLPREPVLDHLTRFSGVVAKDLHSKLSPHHLISTRAAYLKLRCLLERGCIFVGHGLQQDFWTANLAVPSNQIIDTVAIYHKPAQRYISLRFLTNFYLKHDMQQDVHDSLEDAWAAYELYARAVGWKRTGEFSKKLDELYEYGQKTDWKLGVD